MSNRIGTSLIAYVGFGALFFAAGIAPFAGAQAAVVVSFAQTQNMSCAAGVCVPTASNAVLNVSDLEAMLATGNVEVTTTGSGVQAGDIDIGAPLSWSATNMLSLDAYQSITIEKPVTIAGHSGLSIVTNDGGSGGAFSFARKGHVVLYNLSSQLSINGTAYVLVDSISSLASAIAANPGGAYALANDYDATADGTYSVSPIQSGFTGTFEGLNSAIVHLSIDGSGYIGLFNSESGSIRDLNLLKISYTVSGGSVVGGIAGAVGNLSHVRVTGVIRGRGAGNAGSLIGGLAGARGPIVDCSADVRIIGNQTDAVGGLVGLSGGIDESFSTGSVSAIGTGSVVGGLVSSNLDKIRNSYATGPVTGAPHSKIGGLVGENGESHILPGDIDTSYATGAVTGGNRGNAGGFAGIARSAKGHFIKNSYWDTTTSGTDEGTGRGNIRGVTGLTTQQFQSRLPAGFDPKVWAENPKINNGFPYLIANPPRE